jgi:hypothetical protein
MSLTIIIEDRLRKFDLNLKSIKGGALIATFELDDHHMWSIPIID